MNIINYINYNYYIKMNENCLAAPLLPLFCSPYM